MRNSTDAPCFPRDLMSANLRLCGSRTPTMKAVGGGGGTAWVVLGPGCLAEAHLCNAWSNAA